MENNKMDLGASAIAETGSHASHGAAEASPPIGFDPARERIAKFLDWWANDQRQIGQRAKDSHKSLEYLSRSCALRDAARALRERDDLDRWEP